MIDGAGMIDTDRSSWSSAADRVEQHLGYPTHQAPERFGAPGPSSCAGMAFQRRGNPAYLRIAARDHVV